MLLCLSPFNIVIVVSLFLPTGGHNNNHPYAVFVDDDFLCVTYKATLWYYVVLLCGSQNGISPYKF